MKYLIQVGILVTNQQVLVRFGYAICLYPQQKLKSVAQQDKPIQITLESPDLHQYATDLMMWKKVNAPLAIPGFHFFLFFIKKIG